MICTCTQSGAVLLKNDRAVINQNVEQKSYIRKIKPNETFGNKCDCTAAVITQNVEPNSDIIMKHNEIFGNNYGCSAVKTAI